MHSRSLRTSRGRLLLVMVVAAFGAPTSSSAQAPPVPAPSPATDVEGRLKRLEDANRELADQNRKLQEQLQVLIQKIPAPTEAPAGAADATGPEVPATVAPSPTDTEGGEGGEDALANNSARRPTPPGGAKPRGIVRIGPGFMLESEDEEFQLQFHNQTQTEIRQFEQNNQIPSAGGFDVPRQRLIFQGRLTKPIEFEAAIDAGFGTAQLLNAYLNFHYDDRVMFKFGRFKVPFEYEFYAISNVDLLQPERSVFGVNFGLNRENGAQLFGQVWDKRLDYAVGVFNGARNQVVDFNGGKDVIAYLNYRPFQEAEGLEALKFFNIGGSVSAGNQNNPVFPNVLTTSVNGTNNPNALTAAPAFFAFTPGTLERGDRQLYSLHSAYFYKGLSVIGEWQGGFQDYGRLRDATNTQVPLGGFYLSGGYFLTGETLERRTQFDPKRPFDLRKGKFGLGAVELQARYAMLNIGREIFDAGFADPNLWANRVGVTDLGFNWYLNRYVKIYFDWQHSEFNQPAQFAINRFQKTSDLFWVRFQVYF